MQKKLFFFIVDDDEVIKEQLTKLLTDAGHKVSSALSSSEALSQIIAQQPDCVLCDLLLPGLDGLELFQNIRKTENIKQPIFIIITGKQYEYDRRRALNLGVQGYINKPFNVKTITNDILEIASDNLTVEFWGCRGTLPVAGKSATRYGGNTNCVTVCIARKHFFIFDAGTGIKVLSDHLVKENKLPITAKIFITHPHYDHVIGLPFFVPLYMKRNEFELIGTDQMDISFEKLIWQLMDSVYFPVTMKEFSSQVSFKSMKEEEITYGDVTVQSMLLNHPGRCLGYRLQYKNKIFCYITDNELFLENSPHYNQTQEERLIHFVNQADVLIMDATYTDEVYPQKIEWGHSSVSRVVDVADKAKVKLLCLFHHDPDQTDEDIDAKVELARSLLKSRNSITQCIAPSEGQKLEI